jgi:hypothetical protein
VLQSVELLPVPLALPLELLGNLLLENQGLKGVVTLLLSTSEADRKPGRVVLLLVDETSQAAVFALVALDLDLKVLSLLGEGVGKRLEFEELYRVRILLASSMIHGSSPAASSSPTPQRGSCCAS